VTKLLIERDGIDPELAEFASSAAQGHIGRARYLATNKEAREIREKILNLPSTVKDLASAFEAANTLLEMAKEQAKAESEIRNEEELTKLKEFYGTTGSRLAMGGTKAVKELEKEQKTRSNRLVRDNLDSALLDIASIYSQVLLSKLNHNHPKVVQRSQNQLSKNNSNISEEVALKTITAISETRSSLSKNSSPNLLIESLFSSFIV
jgi:DNA polymerase-3 subunit delta'